VGSTRGVTQMGESIGLVTFMQYDVGISTMRCVG
jgi:hypothetical protein